MIKTLLKSVREYKLFSICCPMLMACEAAMDIVIPFIMTALIDGAISLIFLAAAVLLVGTNMAVGVLPGNVSASDLQTLVAYSIQILTGVLMVAMSINYISMSYVQSMKIN